jgi:beta-lactamase class D
VKLIKLFFLLTVPIMFNACRFNKAEEIRDDFKTFYDHYKVEGSFVMYDQNNDRYVFYNHQQYRQEFIPASTFKICNSLIGLETGVIKDENFVIPWDSVIRQNPDWNKDQDLKTALKNSTVWYYQELARRVGGKQMKFWLDKAQYGNADTSGGIDKFWLSGKLRVTPEKQIDFLRRLHSGQLPFSKRSMDIAKKIMISRDTLGYRICAKTGWGIMENRDIGWFVGYLETNNNVYYFANCIQTNDSDNREFATARKEIVFLILKDLKLIR